MTASRMNSPHTAIVGPSSSIVAQVRGYLGTSLEILRAVVHVVAVGLDAVNEAHGLAALVAGRKDLRPDTFGTLPSLTRFQHSTGYPSNVTRCRSPQYRGC